MAESARIAVPIDESILAKATLRFFVDSADGTVDLNRPMSTARARPRGASDPVHLVTGHLMGYHMAVVNGGGHLEGAHLEHGHQSWQDLVIHQFGNFYGPAGTNGYLTFKTKIYDKDGRVSASTPPDVTIVFDTDPFPPYAMRGYSYNDDTGQDQIYVTGQASKALANDDGSKY